MIIDETTIGYLTVLYVLTYFSEHPDEIPKDKQEEYLKYAVEHGLLEEPKPFEIPKLTIEDVRKAIGNDQVADFFFAGPAD